MIVEGKGEMQHIEEFRMNDNDITHKTIFGLCNQDSVQYFDENCAQLFLKDRIKAILNRLQDLNLMHFSLIDDTGF